MFQSLAQSFSIEYITPLQNDDRPVNRMPANGSKVKKQSYVMYYVMQEYLPAIANQ